MEVNSRFSGEVAGDRVKMLLPSISILFTNVYQKSFDFVNTG